LVTLLECDKKRKAVRPVGLWIQEKRKQTCTAPALMKNISLPSSPARMIMSFLKYTCKSQTDFNEACVLTT
jgi:hypothetical protein